MTGDYSATTHEALIRRVLSTGSLSGTIDLAGLMVTYNLEDYANEMLRQIEFAKRMDYFDHDGRITMHNLGIL